jgi:hypothetical protein
MHPDWLGSPQHVVGGVVLAALCVPASRWLGVRGALAMVILAVGVTMTAETLIEIAEYAILYSTPTISSYFDTIADLTSTLVGALLGAAAGVAYTQRSDRHRRARHART